MNNVFWTVLLVIGLIIALSLIVCGIGICFTTLPIIAKYVIFVLSVGIGIVGGSISTILLLAD